MKNTMGGRIRELRKQRGLTQEDLGEILYMKKSTISAYENDEIDIKSSVLVEIARALHTFPGYFFILDSNDESEELSETIQLVNRIKDQKYRRAALEHIRITYALEVQ